MKIRVASAKDYDYSAGYLIESKGYGERYFAVPPWEEMGYPELAGLFPTRRAAEVALDKL